MHIVVDKPTDTILKNILGRDTPRERSVTLDMEMEKPKRATRVDEEAQLTACKATSDTTDSAEASTSKKTI